MEKIFNFKFCFKLRFSNVPNGGSKYQPWNLKHLAGNFVGGRCQVSFGTCADEDKSCLEECSLRWTGWGEGEGGRQVANAGAASSQATAEVQVARTISLVYTCTRCFPVTSLIFTGTPTSCLEVLYPDGCLGQRSTGMEHGSSSTGPIMKPGWGRKGHRRNKAKPPLWLGFIFLSGQSPGREMFCSAENTEGCFAPPAAWPL